MIELPEAPNRNIESAQALQEELPTNHGFPPFFKRRNLATSWPKEIALRQQRKSVVRNWKHTRNFAETWNYKFIAHGEAQATRWH